MIETEQKAAVQQCVPQRMQDYQVPGVSITCIHTGRLAWSQGWGVTDKESNLPVTQDTVFEAASLGKPVLAYAALKLCETGVLTLDAPLSDYLPEPYIPNCPSLEQVTLRRVLSHTSGFPNWRPKRFSPQPSPLTINFAPGERFSYSGEGYKYLQRVIEHLTNQPLVDYIEANVFLPLQMTLCAYVWREPYQMLLARGHDRNGKPVPWNNFEKANAAFSLYATPADYARFVQRIITTGQSQMMASQVSLTDELSWGLGWGLWQQSGKESFWHWGDNGVYQSFITASLIAGEGLVIMTNGHQGQALCRDVCAMFLGEPHPAFAWLERSFYQTKLA